CSAKAVSRARATAGLGRLVLARTRSETLLPIRIRWCIPQVGYSASAIEPNAFGIVDDLAIVTVTPTDGGTVFEWEQRYNAADLAMAVGSFEHGLSDIAEQLIARLGGKMHVNWAQPVPAAS